VLRAELETLGRTFPTRVDTEVLLKPARVSTTVFPAAGPQSVGVV
jgi:hypothetical protein